MLKDSQMFGVTILVEESQNAVLATKYTVIFVLYVVK